MGESESDRGGGTESDQPTIRPLESDDHERIREIAESSMTASYAMSPNEIETVLEEEFEGDALRERSEDADGEVFVAERGDVLAGFVEITLDDGNGIVRWLHVDPDHRGRGVGTALFEYAVAELEDESEGVRGHVLAPNTSAGAFFERFDFEQIDERTVDIGDRETVQYVYAEHADDESVAGETGIAEEASEVDEVADIEDLDLPDTVTTEDGETVYLGDDHFQGTEGLFVLTYADADREEEYGYYCTNCETTDVSVDTMDRLQCQTCGNLHKSKEDYDESYL